MGRQSSIDFLASVAGRVMLLSARGWPQPLLSSLPEAFRVAMNYGSSRLEWLGPRQGQLHAPCSFMPPPFHEGMVRQFLEAAGARGIQATALGGRARGRVRVLLAVSCPLPDTYGAVR